MVTRVRVDSCSEKGVDFNTPCRLKSHENARLSPRFAVTAENPGQFDAASNRALAIPLLHEPAHASFSQYQHCPGQDYRDGYANSVQVRASVWDFMSIFGAARQDSPDEVVLRNFQGIYLSPQQAKALWNLLGQNLAQYEQAFGAINLEPTQAFPAAGTGNGPIH